MNKVVEIIFDVFTLIFIIVSCFFLLGVGIYFWRLLG